jgi:hypothetical protein
MANKEKMIFEEIMLRHPPPLRIEHARIATERIDFDPDNPRLRYLKQVYPDKTEQQLLFGEGDKGDDTAWLMKDIKEKGVIDPIYVREVGERFVVIEGNRRTACMKQLQQTEPKEAKFATMPARILPEKTTEEQTALLMASFHVSGKVKWEPHEKAGHVYHMLRVLHIPEAEMSTTLHMGVPALKRLADSFAILEENYKKVDGGKYAATAAGRWSFFSEMLRIKPLKERHAKDPTFADDFCRWVGEGRIPNAIDVRYLPDILQKQKARHLFLNEPVADGIAWTKARQAADETKPANVSKLFKQIERTLNMARVANFTDMDLAQHNESAQQLLTEAYNQLGALMEKANVPRVSPPRRVA